MAYSHASFFWMHFNEVRILSALIGNFRHTTEESKTHTLITLLQQSFFRSSRNKMATQLDLISLHPSNRCAYKKLHVTQQCHRWGYFKPKEAFLIIKMKWGIN